MPLVSRLDAPEVWATIRALRAQMATRDAILIALRERHGVTVSLSALDVWLRTRAHGKRGRFRHQVPAPPAAETSKETVSPASVAPAFQSQPLTNSRADLARRLGI